MERNEGLVAVRRAFELLEAVAPHRQGMSFGDIRRTMPKLTAASLTRLLKVLLQEHLLKKAEHERLYQLGPRALQLGEAVRERLSLAQLMQPLVQELAAETNEAAAFFVFERDAAVLLAKAEQPEGFHYMATLGRNNHFGLHAFATMCLAHQPAGQIGRILRALPEQEGLRQQLTKTAQRRVLVNSRDDRPGILRLVAPVFIQSSPEFSGFVGALGLTLLQGSVQKGQLQELAQVVTQKAEAAGACLQRRHWSLTQEQGLTR